MKKLTLLTASFLMLFSITTFAQEEYKLESPHLSIGVLFTRIAVNLGYYGGLWNGNVWLAKEPYIFKTEGAVRPYMPEDIYDIRRVVYINRPGAIRGRIPIGEYPDPGYDYNWRDNFIEITRSTTDCVIKKGINTVCDLITLPVDDITRLVTLTFKDGKWKTCGYPGSPCDGDPTYWVNDYYTTAVAEVRVPGTEDLYVPVVFTTEGVGNLEQFGIDGTVHPSTEDNYKVEVTYNQVGAVPFNSYAVILKDVNTYCLYNYSKDDFNSVYEAIKTGGVEAGFNRFKQTVKSRCANTEIIGFINITPPGGWKSWQINEPYKVTLSDRPDGKPFAIPLEGGKTIASGGKFNISTMQMINDPNALKELPKDRYPGSFGGATITIPAGYDPGLEIENVNIDEIITILDNGHSVVINKEGEATLQLFNFQGRLVKEIPVNGSTTVIIREQESSGIYFLRYIQDMTVGAKKVIFR